MVISIKEWRKMMWHESGQVFANIRIGELAQLGLKREDMPIVLKTTVIKPNQILFTFKRENEEVEEDRFIKEDNEAVELLEKMRKEEKKQAKAENGGWKLSDEIDVL